MNRFFLIGLVFSASTISSFAFADGLTCPTQMRGGLIDAWRETAISKVIAGEFGVVHNSLKQCFPDGTPKCLQSLSDYTKENSNRSEPITEEEGKKFLTIQSEKELPPEFLVKGLLGGTKDGLVKIPENILALSKEKGWKSVSYKTRSTGGFDQAPNLLLVVVPGADKDIFLQTSPHPDVNPQASHDNPNPATSTGNLSTGQDTLTIITLDKTKTPPVGQLRLLKLDRAEKAYRFTNNLESRSCSECHSVPLRSISPRGYLTTNNTEQRLTPQEEAHITDINDRMVATDMSWGHQAVNGHKVRLGPPLDSRPTGWAPPGSPTRTEEFIRRCAQNERTINYRGFGDYRVTFPGNSNAVVDYQAVAQAMNCYECHNNKIRGVLHENFSRDEIVFKVLVDRSMPRGGAGDQLSLDDRMALVNCLDAERNDRNQSRDLALEWRRSGLWMKDQFCEDLVRSPNPSSTNRPAANAPAAR